MQKLLRCALALAMVLVTSSMARAGELKLTMSNGLVTIVADEVPVSRILAEWARVGKTQIVGGDKLLTTVSLQLVDVPEAKALDVVLRSASGYMAAQRDSIRADASTFDRIMILPFSKGPALSALPSTPAAFAPRPNIQPVDAEGPDMSMPPGAMMNPEQQNGPPQNGPQSMPGMPQRAPGMAPGPNVPMTAPRPGQLPAPPGAQPVPFGAPRPPGTGPGGGGPGGGGF